jgi:hypothetical protein
MNSYRTANQLQAGQQSYDYRRELEFSSNHKKWQAAKLLRNLDSAAILDAKPVFVIGMPRSGTSLVEQILASHPQVSGSGKVEYSYRTIFCESVCWRRSCLEPVLCFVSAIPWLCACLFMANTFRVHMAMPAT